MRQAFTNTLFPRERRLVMSMASAVRRALSAGAAGYLPKRSSDRDLLAAIRLIAGGAGYVDECHHA